MVKKLFFGELEQAIMDVAWDRDGVTVRDVLYSLSRRSTAYTTVMTVMNRLVAQKMLRRRMGQDGAFVYHPATSREEYNMTASRQRAQELVKHYGDAALVQFLDTLDRIPDKKLAELKRRAKKQS